MDRLFSFVVRPLVPRSREERIQTTLSAYDIYHFVVKCLLSQFCIARLRSLHRVSLLSSYSRSSSPSTDTRPSRTLPLTPVLYMGSAKAVSGMATYLCQRRHSSIVGKTGFCFFLDQIVLYFLSLWHIQPQLVFFCERSVFLGVRFF